MNANNPLVLGMEDHLIQESSLVGGKAANLAILNRLPGIDVPPAVVITTEAYDGLLHENPELSEMIEGMDDIADPEQLSHQAEAIQIALGSASLPESGYDAISSACVKLGRLVSPCRFRIAVRSSATAEDTPDASFAGQYETCLDRQSLEEVIESVRRVWSSTFSVNAVSYRSSRGISHRATKMAIILQQMVDAKVSGTAFTVDLETGLPMIRIHTSYGFGEAEVRGTVTPDTWIVDPKSMTIVKRCLGSKTEALDFDPVLNRTVERETTSDEQSRFAADFATIRLLARRVEQIGDQYLATQAVACIDTEFAIDAAGRIFFTQARPETVWARRTSHSAAVDLRRATSMSRIIEGGFTGCGGVATGPARVVASLQDAERRVQSGDILVVANTTNLWERVLGLVAGAITDIGGPGCHTATVMREQGKPALVGIPNATSTLSGYDNQTITLDATQRIVFLGDVPRDWRYTADGSDPIYGELDSETEEESWNEASRTGQTHVDGSGRRWIGKPKHPVGKFMQEVYLECHKWVGERLAAPVSAEIHDRVHRMDFHELYQWRLKLRMMSLEDMEQLHRERLATAEAYLDSSIRFDCSPDSFLEWLKHFIRMNGFMGLSYQIHKVAEGLLDHELARKRLPEPYHSEARPAMGALLGETEATRELRGYTSLLDDARSNRSLVRELVRSAESGDLAQLRRKHPGFYGKLRRHASMFKVVKTTDLALPLEDSIVEVVRRLGSDCIRDRQVQIHGNTPAEFYPEDERFVRIARLTLEAEKARQDAHHVNSRGHWPVQEKLLPLGEWLTRKGELSGVGDLFEHSPCWLLRQLIRWRMAQWLEDFSGQPLDVRPVPEYISIPFYGRLRSFGFDLIYLPELDTSSVEAIRRYPGWRYPLARVCWERADEKWLRLNSRWVAVEMYPEPSDHTRTCGKDRLVGILGKGTRVLSWNTVHGSVLSGISALLGMDSTRFRLPFPLEWNLIGNLLRRRQEFGENYRWEFDAGWEWTEGECDPFMRVLVGKNGVEGLEPLQSVCWIDSRRECCRAHAFRILITL
jgi:phosphohistidine swiveling domain-containing protein